MSASSPVIRESQELEPTTTKKEVEGEASASQDDDEDNTARRLSMLEEEVTFLSTDSTADVPHPANHFFVASDNVDVETVRFTSLPHPRSGKMNAFAVASAAVTQKTEQEEKKVQQPVLLEVQRHRPQFCTMFYGDTVEPTSPLTFLLPIDIIFFALRLISTEGSRVKTSFVSFDDVLDEGAQGNARVCFGTLPALLVKSLEASLTYLCDTQEFGEDKYYRYSESKTKLWFETKLQMTMNNDHARQLLLGIPNVASSAASPTSATTEEASPTTTTTTTTESSPTSSPTVDVTLLREKSARMLLEYTPSYLHASLRQALGVGEKTSSKKVVGLCAATAGGESGTGVSHWERGKRDRDMEDDIVVKPKAKDERSANVKRLEKAGPPKGVPSILNFFKKKKE